MIKQISIIGCRAFPSDFEGTSGIESYTEKVVGKMLDSDDRLRFCFYTKDNYQKLIRPKPIKNIKVIGIFSLRLKVFESVIYSFLASIRSSFDDSKIVWYHGVGPAIFSFIPKIFGKKIVLTVHSLDWQRDKWSRIEKKIFHLLASLSIIVSDKIFCVSEKLKDFVENNFKKETVLAMAGIEVAGVSKDSEKYLAKYSLKKARYLIYLGRVVPEKRLEWLLESFEKLKDKNIKLVLCGGHGNMPLYEQKLKSRHLNPNIIWTGYVFGEEKNSLLGNSLCFVLPSKLEGLSISFLEALGSKRMCIVPKEFAGIFASLSNVHTFSDRKEFDFLIKNVLRICKKMSVFTSKEIAIINKQKWETASDSYRMVFTREV